MWECERRRIENKNGVHERKVAISGAILCMSESVHDSISIVPTSPGARQSPCKGLISRKVIIVEFPISLLEFEFTENRTGFSAN